MDHYAVRGRSFIRAMIVRQLAGASGDVADALARSRYGPAVGPYVAKAAVGAITSADGLDEPASEFLGLAIEASVLSRLGLRRVPFNVRVIAMTAGATGFWVGEGESKPISKPAIAGSTLMPLKVASIIVATRESLEVVAAEELLQSDIEAAVSGALDLAFLDGNAGVPGERPASITSGAPTIASTGDPVADLSALVAAFTGDLSTSSFVSDPVTVAELALARDAGGAFAFPDASPRGGSLLGLPLVVSRHSPRDSSGGQIALIDGQAVAVALGTITVDKAAHTSLLMSDDPEVDSGSMVSLWQKNAVALRSEAEANWQLQRAGGVAVLTGATYAAV